MILTKSQREAVSHPGHVLLDACPGSGKTRALIAKLLRACDAVRGSSQRVACITYTNAAVHEIEERLHRLGAHGDAELCHIATIHAFCLQQILRPFSWLISEIPIGFALVTSDDRIFQDAVESVSKAHGIQADLEAFATLVRGSDGFAVNVDRVPSRAADDFWSTLLAGGVIDFASVLYYAQRVVKEYPWTARALASRYTVCLLDESQDTTHVQLEILRAIEAFKTTTFFLVGDSHQSIFGFAGADPKHLRRFAADIGARNDIELLDNFRSGPRVINTVESFRHRGMRVGSSSQQLHTASVDWHQVSTPFEGIVDHFLPALDSLGIGLGDAAVLAPWWIPLLKLGRQLREYGVPIVGPGARPYKRHHAFAELAEQLCATIEARCPSLVPLERQLFHTLSELTGHQAFRVFTYEGRFLLYRMIHEVERIRDEEAGSGVRWLRSAAQSVTDILRAEDWLPASHALALTDSAEDMIADMVRNKVDVQNLSTESLGLFASNDMNLKLMTMHRSKGREFKAVALIDLHDGRVPDFRASSAEAIDEGRRLLYVAMTRAERKLMIFTDSSHYMNQPSRFLQELSL